MAALTSHRYELLSPRRRCLELQRIFSTHRFSRQLKEEEETRGIGGWAPVGLGEAHGAGSTRYTDTIEIAETQRSPLRDESYVHTPLQHAVQDLGGTVAPSKRFSKSVNDNLDRMHVDVGILALKNPGLSAYDLSPQRDSRPGSRSGSAKVTGLLSTKSSDCEKRHHHNEALHSAYPTRDHHEKSSNSQSTTSLPKHLVVAVRPASARLTNRASTSGTDLAHNLDKYLGKIDSVKNDLDAVKLRDYGQGSSEQTSPSGRSGETSGTELSCQDVTDSSEVAEDISSPPADGDTGRAPSGQAAEGSGLGTSSSAQGLGQGSGKHGSRARSSRRKDTESITRVRRRRREVPGFQNPHFCCLKPDCPGSEEYMSGILKCAALLHGHYFCPICLQGRKIPELIGTEVIPSDWHDCPGRHCIMLECGGHIGPVTEDVRSRRHPKSPERSACRSWEELGQEEQFEYLYPIFNDGASLLNYWREGKRLHTGQIGRHSRPSQEQLRSMEFERQIRHRDQRIVELQRQKDELQRQKDEIQEGFQQRLTELQAEGKRYKSQVQWLVQDLTDTKEALAEREKELVACRSACTEKDGRIAGQEQTIFLLACGGGLPSTIDPQEKDTR